MRFAAKWTAVLAIWGVVLGGAVLAYFAYTLPDVSVALSSERKPQVTLSAADGARIATLGQSYGGPASVHALPPHLPRAVIATEDRRFYDHFGLDPIGLARAMAANLMAGRVVQGGSTITQQVAKNLFLTHDRTFARKARELLLALWLEKTYSKDQILGLYLNRVYLGAGTYGVEAAARRYFGKSATKVSLYEAAVLAGLLKAPSRYDPTRNPDLSHARATQVLANMVAAGYLSAAEAKTAAENRATAGTVAASGGSGRWFADWAMSEAAAQVGPDVGDMVVATTLDPRIQAAAERRLAALLNGPGRAAGVGEGAVVVMGRNGAVKAMVGGADYRQSQFNRAVQALRQPGSAMKPLVYLAGIEAGLSPETVMIDEPIDMGGWRPENYDGTYRGAVTLREALARSINTVAVKVAARAGPGRVVATARRLGISTDLPADLGLALGTAEVSLLELTAAYAAFAQGGIGAWPHGVTSVAAARDGQVLFRREGGGPGRVVSEKAAAAVADMLAHAIEDGTGARAALDRPAAGKTGTSQDFRDAWFVGFTADLVAGVWLGNDDGTPMKGVTGGGLPAALWAAIMTDAHAGLPPRSLPKAPAAERLPPPPAPAVGDGLFDRLKRLLSPD